MSPSARPVENVWKYPRPPALQKTASRLRVIWVHPGGKETTVADTTQGYRVLETSHPPTYYFPPSSILSPMQLRSSSARRTYCEWKGTAAYHDLVGEEGKVLSKGRIWSYPDPTGGFREIKDFLCFYCSSRSDESTAGSWKCLVDEDVAAPQAGDFYGSWVTPEITGGEKGFKGGESGGMILQGSSPAGY
ncbi:DUF427-domain-containing protein [Microstroma glucosiphilum]|uniref:DUF427-domain-containing protein n=1 Tax=Pseudomicrostroma glucosiphilum TaxID=1684307 RepID=A0A316UD55_9BASI|nr:DUF427-domain-containing protein [Pseudomicrostroma glucosiphilum]PWN22303.1 DUF427-domain-containing protein [Pseudomicrostroma glucosiphilum]